MIVGGILVVKRRDSHSLTMGNAQINQQKCKKVNQQRRGKFYGSLKKLCKGSYG
jgi:hypothetical protein